MRNITNRILLVSIVSWALATGCRTMPIDPPRVHDPNSGPALKETWISVNDGDSAKTSECTCVSPLRKKGVFGGNRSSINNQRNVYWEYVDTLGTQDAYYFRVWEADWNAPIFEDVILYQGEEKLAYTENGLKVLLATKP